MRIRGLVIASGLLLLGGPAFGGCTDADESPRSGFKGETCQSSRDCAPGLACMPASSGMGGTCVVGAFNVAKTGKECAIIECETATDCRDATPTSECENLLRTCQADGGFSADACSQYRT